MVVVVFSITHPGTKHPKDTLPRLDRTRKRVRSSLALLKKVFTSSRWMGRCGRAGFAGGLVAVLGGSGFVSGF